jgi:hypothetical protein
MKIESQTIVYIWGDGKAMYTKYWFVVSQSTYRKYLISFIEKSVFAIFSLFLKQKYIFGTF